MSCDQRLCRGVAGRRCGAFMPPLFRDPHPTCAGCRGRKYTADVTCDICKDLSVAQWEAFLKRRPYSKKCPSGSDLPSAPPTLPPSALAPSGAGCPVPPPRSLPPPSEGRDRSGEMEGVPRVGSREVSPPPSRRSVGEERGDAARASAFAGASFSAASSLPGIGVAGSSRSQESLVFADPSPVDSSVSAGGDRRSPTPEVGGSTGDRSRSYPSRGRDDREERRCARSRSRGSCARSRKSCSRFTDRSWLSGRKPSRSDSSRSPSACVRSRRSRS